MKKYLFVVLMSGTLLLTGCNSEEKTMTCTRSVNRNSISMDMKYTVKYSGKNVTKIDTVEKVVSDDKSTLDFYKSKLDESYEDYKDIKYYENEISVDGNTLTSTTSIDYSKIDTDKLIQIDSSNKKLIEDGKINIDTIKSYYESLGITCEK